MADLFKCDKCGAVKPPTQKRGRLILQELRDNQPHMSYYNKKAEVCEQCFWQLQKLMNNTGAQITTDVHVTVPDNPPRLGE